LELQKTNINNRTELNTKPSVNTENIKIVEVCDKKGEKDFVKFPWKVYKDNPYWVPPLISDSLKTIRGENNTLKESGPYTLLLAYKEDVLCGRLCVGINNVLNNAKNYAEGYLSLFECIEDYSVCKALFDYANSWLKKRGMTKIIGPLAPPDGDDCRGLLIDCYDDDPYVMNVYNPPYYVDFFEQYGFYKYWDCYAYHLEVKQGAPERYKRMVPYAMEKYGFKVDMIDLENIQRDMADIKRILDEAMPEEWEDFVPPTDEEIELMAKNLVPVAVPDLIYIARTKEGRPIGFNIAMPDYNQVLKSMDGKKFPFGVFKYLFGKKKINRCRLFVLFVVPEYRKKGVTAAIYVHCEDAFKRHGYDAVEGSTIWEYNVAMRRDIEKLGGKINKTFRIYKKDII